MTQKICYLLRIDPAQSEEYLRRHEAVWPEMLHTLSAAGFRNYSVFLDASGLLVVYLETDDYQAGVEKMAASEVEKAWSQFMGEMFLPVDADREVGTLTPLLHAFDLDSQLRELQS